jgi:hypothetical protein
MVVPKGGETYMEIIIQEIIKLVTVIIFFLPLIILVVALEWLTPNGVGKDIF